MAVCVASVMMFSMFATSCSKANIVRKDAVTVEADTPWYTLEKDRVGTEYNHDDYIFFGQTALGPYKDMYLFQTDGKVKDYENSPYEGRILNLDFQAKDGSLIKSVDIVESVMESDDLLKAEAFLLDSLYVENDEIKIILTIVFRDETNSWDEEAYECKIDFEQGKIVEPKLYKPDSIISNYYFDEAIDVGDGYKISKYWNFGGPTGFKHVIELSKPDGTRMVINPENVFSDTFVTSVDCIYSSDDTTAIIGVTNGDTYQRLWFSIDLPTGECKVIDSDMGWVNVLNSDGMVYLPSQGCYTIDTEGIKRVDFDSETVDLVLDFNYCNIDRFEVPSLKICSVSDDEYVLIGSIYTAKTGIMEETNSYVYTLSKCDTNPNAGKEVLTIASTSELNNAVSKAILDFNQESEEYFLVFDNSYLVTNYLYEHAAESTGDVVLDTYNAQSELNMILALDLMTGDGPDIVLNAFDCNMINKPDCLMDLSAFVNKESNILPNVIKASKEGSNLYQLPVSFGVKGIVTSSKNVKKSGFTFSEYEKFVSETCNGHDPLRMDRIDFVDEVLASMNDLIIKHGGDNTIETKAIKATAEYAKEKVPQTYIELYGDELVATYATINGFGSFLLGEYTNGGIDIGSMTVVGLPSTDGRGPTIIVDNSVAIAADVNNPDACWSFCQKLLSDDIQRILFATGTPVNEEVLVEMSKAAIEDYNLLRESYIIDEADALILYELGMALEADESYADKYVDVVKSCSVISNSYDATVKMIIRQEIQGYLQDDKPLDEVVKIMQNEIKTYMDERS